MHSRPPAAVSDPPIRLEPMSVALDPSASAAGTASFPWDAVWGQDEAVQTLQAAASDPSALAHAWLITGPPGSGRSTLAYAFAAALIADPGDENAQRQVLARTHPDLTALVAGRLGIRHVDEPTSDEGASVGPSLGPTPISPPCAPSRS